MRAGLLNEPVTLLRAETEPTAYRSQLVRWVKAFDTKARVRNAGSSMTLANSEEFYGVHAVFTVRIYHKITPTMRIRWRGRDYRILGLDPNRQTMELVIKTELVNE